jgi:hypothetical protein
MGALERRGGGFALSGLVVGLAAGFAAYAVADLGTAREDPLQLAALTAISAFGASFLLIVERREFLRSALFAAGIAALLALATYALLSAGRNEARLVAWPRFFWFAAGLPLTFYLMTALSKAALHRTPPPYSCVFVEGLTLPIILKGAALVSLLAFVLVYAAAWLTKTLEIEALHRVFQEPWFMFPFAGAVLGFSIGTMRGLHSVLGALRYMLLLGARVAMPVVAALSLAFAASFVLNGPAAVFAAPSPATLNLALALIAMLVFNGVYQNGEGEPPPAWLRLSALISLLALPLYAGFAGWALWLRIEQYGLTPARIAGLAVASLVMLYAILCVASLVTELNWRGKRWMPLIGPVNTLMAMLWVAAMLALATPLLNPWEISARNQERRLAEARVAPAAFDYGYLRFRLGRYGDAALDRLFALETHPQSAEIRAGVARVRAAATQWDFEHPSSLEAPTPERRDAPPGLEDLPLDPD